MLEKSKKVGIFVAHAILGIAILAGIVGCVMLLWNMLIPSITGWTTITYWQALGLMALATLLRPRPKHGHGHHGKHSHHGHHGGNCTYPDCNHLHEILERED